MISGIIRGELCSILTCHCSRACSINLGSTVLLTGGGNVQGNRAFNIVSEYDQRKKLRDLPQLLQGRYNHGCSYFEDEEGTKVEISSNSWGVIIFQTLLVAGGYDPSIEIANDRFISSTELLKMNADSWIKTGDLPHPRDGLKGLNIDQRVVVFFEPGQVVWKDTINRKLR